MLCAAGFISIAETEARSPKMLTRTLTLERKEAFLGFLGKEGVL